MTNELYLPEAMKAVCNWCAWRLEERNEKKTKVPYMLPHRRAESNNRNTWSSFDTITAILESAQGYFSGYGFMIADGFVFVDVDHCIDDNGEIDERGKDVLEAFPLSYAEFSQSGHGLHVITRGTIPRGFNNRSKGVEMYSSGKFCACTGWAIQKNEPTEEQDGINYIFYKYSTKVKKDPRSQPTSNLTRGEERSDGWIVRHAMAVNGQQGRNFYCLYHGDTSAYESASEADSALCTLLAFWCDRNMEQMDRLFRQSGLYRPKWEREDYRLRTMQHACDHIPETLSEWQMSQQRKLEEKMRTASAYQIFGDGGGLL